MTVLGLSVSDRQVRVQQCHCESADAGQSAGRCQAFSLSFSSATTKYMRRHHRTEIPVPSPKQERAAPMSRRKRSKSEYWTKGSERYPSFICTNSSSRFVGRNMLSRLSQLLSRRSRACAARWPRVLARRHDEISGMMREMSSRGRIGILDAQYGKRCLKAHHHHHHSRLQYSFQ